MTRDMLRPLGTTACLALAMCAPRTTAGPPVPAGPIESDRTAAAAAVEIRVCVLTPESRLQEVTASFRPQSNDTLLDGRPFHELHSPQQPRYAAGHHWFVIQQPVLMLGHEYLPFGVTRPVDAEGLSSVGSFRGVPLFTEAGSPATPDVLYVPVRPGCEMQPYRLSGTGLRFHWPPPWPNPSTPPDGDLRFARIAAGSMYVCGLSGEGDVYCWGEIVPDSGRPDDDPSGDGAMPAAVDGGTRFVAISTGSEHTCALTGDGQVYCSGINEYGQLGDGTTRARFRPAPVVGGLRFATLSVGGAHSCALTRDGRAYCWGWNEAGRLGDGTTTSRHRPTAVAGGLRFSTLSAGAAFTCALTTEGQAYCWGWNDSHQLGDGSVTDRHRPVPVAGTLDFTTVSAGGRHACALTSAGDAYCWGSNWDGQLGNETIAGTADSPGPVTGGLRFTSIAAGDRHSCGITARSEAYCWGSNSRGQLGDGSLDDRPAPAAVAGGLRFDAVAVGDEHSCALTVEGEVYCWGRNSHGQLGGTSGHYRLVPTPAFR